MALLVEKALKFTLADFRRVRELAYHHAGIVLSPAKNHMAYARLAKRVRGAGMERFSDYLDWLHQHPDDAEWQRFVNALTTNLTFFFREAHHFAMLAEHAQQHASPARPYRVWSAAASTGEEAYSIAMTLAQVFGAGAQRREVLASDIDTQVLEVAARGVYPLERLKEVSYPQKQRFFLKGRGANAGMARVKPQLRQDVKFFQINLVSPHWSALGKFDVIFCRNVLIYFDKPTQEAILNRFAEHLHPHGLLLLGHSENIQHLAQPFVPCGRTAYRLAERGEMHKDHA